ncbi:MAG: regulatory protein RecX [Actinomycetota bacterium]|jgi:regulatory protein
MKTSGFSMTGTQLEGDPLDSELRKAMERAGRWLALRPRTVSEMRDRLLQGGFEEGTVERALTRLTELRLIDDESFARQWVEERARRKGLGPRALVAELEAKGVDPEVAGAAVAGAADTEERRAVEWAQRQLRRGVDLPLSKLAQRIRQGLLRRGFDVQVADAATRAVMPPEGWD